MATEQHNKPDQELGISVRLVIQILFLLITILIGLRHILPGDAARGGAFDSFCPFGAIETLWSYIVKGQTLETTSPINFSIFMGILGVSLLAGRAFCGWMCPVGTLQDLLANLTTSLFPLASKKRRKKTNKIPYSISKQNDRWLRGLKYLILGVVLIASIRAIYPPLQPLCPARALFSFLSPTPLIWSVLITFFVTSLLNRRFWCKYLCPLGAVLAPFNKINPLRLVLKEDRCTSCRRCDAACPMEIDDLANHLRSPECIQCLECQEACPEKDVLELRLF